jgi:hypothetical protein
MHASSLAAEYLFKTLGHARNLRPVMGNNILGVCEIITQ